jgi:hypothetical protein
MVHSCQVKLMPIPQQNKVSPQEQSVSDWLREINPASRLVLGLAVCALAAYHIPLIVTALAGENVNTISQWGGTMIYTIILIVQNVIGNKIKQLMLTGVIFATVSTCWCGFIIIHSFRIEQVAEWWSLLWTSITWFPLNAYLFKKYKEVASL